MTLSFGTQISTPVVLSWLGIARELTAGTPVSPVITHPLDQGSFEPEDTPKFLKDMAIRGAMTDLFYETLGVESATFSFGGPNFLDSHGYFFDNVFGDLSTTGSSNANLATASTALAVGAQGMTLPRRSPFRVHRERDHPDRDRRHHRGGRHLRDYRLEHRQLREQPAEVHPPHRTHGVHLRDAVHAPVRGTEHNLGYGGAYGAQPPTHTFTDVTNIVNVFTSATYGTAPSNTYGARQYASACLKSLDFSGNASSSLA